MKKALFFLNPEMLERVYGPNERQTLSGLVELPQVALSRSNWREHAAILKDVEVIISSWGGPIVDEEFLEYAPALQLYLYGAGSIRGLMSDAAWERGIRITSAASANARPVAEFALAEILFSLKNGWQLAHRARFGEDHLWGVDKPMAGLHGSTVGIVSLGMIGRAVCELLKAFDVRVIACDPMADAATFRQAGATPVSLETVFEQSDVISLHTPSLPETKGIIGYDLISRMKPNATLLNTARGSLIREDELIRVLTSRLDLTAVLDVTDPTPPVAGSLLLHLPNVIITPHIAGAYNNECRWLGQCMVGELKRYLSGDPLQWEIHRERMALIA